MCGLREVGDGQLYVLYIHQLYIMKKKIFQTRLMKFKYDGSPRVIWPLNLPQSPSSSVPRNPSVSHNPHLLVSTSVSSNPNLSVPPSVSPTHTCQCPPLSPPTPHLLVSPLTSPTPTFWCSLFLPQPPPVSAPYVCPNGVAGFSPGQNYSRLCCFHSQSYGYFSYNIFPMGIFSLFQYISDHLLALKPVDQELRIDTGDRTCSAVLAIKRLFWSKYSPYNSKF